MQPSTRIVTNEIDDALAALVAQLERSAARLDAVADSFESTGRSSVARVLRHEAATLRRAAAG